ncbi:SDR family NAD(P)-dependent oxidoreductase [Natrarchaeobius sp. A-rgal3]|uniref:SDR family NAD(P)-dependent oxidoreductase n=1 Tax=Natrarchaeobius versutus TaxID=1679078 RepID=UPI00350EC99B
MSDDRLTGDHVVVTGGVRGIGRGIAVRLARAGASVTVFDMDVDAAAATADAIREEGVEALVLEVDVTDREAVSTAFDEAENELGPVSGLANNAGIQRAVPALETTEADLDDHFAVNVKGAVFCAQEAASRMIERGTEGGIVTIASVAAVRPFPGQGAYAASKAGILAFSKALAKEVGDDGLRVNVINPGTVDTPMVQQWLAENAEQTDKSEEELLEDALENHTLDRMGRPEEIGNVVAMLLSAEGAWITGEAINVDGGYTNE